MPSREGISIDESIYLADRTIVTTYRPGIIKKDITVTIPRPRDASTRELDEMKKEQTQLVMEEQRRHEQEVTLRPGLSKKG